MRDAQESGRGREQVCKDILADRDDVPFPGERFDFLQ
jgi:hypothetical protein